jgi:prepilin peptidase CpaA
MIWGLQVNHAAALFLGGFACVFDLRTRRIPNALTFGGAAVALAYALASQGFGGLLIGLEGWGVGLALFLPMFLLGGMGAGDVKLLACLGAWVGPAETFWMAIYAMIAGGVLGVVVALTTGYARQAAANVWMLLKYWRVMGVRPLPELTLANGRGPRLPYAIPIAAGAVAMILLKSR